MAKGFGSMEAEGKKRSVASPFLKLKAGEIAIIRFITDLDDMEWAYFHGVARQTRLGSKNYAEEIYCKMQDDERCEYCEAAGDSDARKVKVRMFFHVFCFGVLHAEKDADGKWKEIQYLGSKYFAETVNQFKILKTGVGTQGNLKERIKSWAKRNADEAHPNGTLTNKVYDWIRQGSGREDTTYDLAPRDGALKDLPEDAKASIASLTPLMQIMKPVAEPKVEKKNKIETADTVLDKLFEDE